MSITLASAPRVYTVVNDVHSQMNATEVASVVRVETESVLRQAITDAAAFNRQVSVAGGRHAMGGQQFGAGTTLLDITGLNRVLDFDELRGTVTVEAGIQWPGLVDHLIRCQLGRPTQWGIVQKQTGADRLSIGGALSANIHGRGLRLKPLVGDVESFVLIDGSGERRRCSRIENSELFRLAIGGYGLFGVISRVTLRLTRRRKIERRVVLGDVRDLPHAFDRRIAEGFEYGDFQFATDIDSPGFLRTGIFSCYRPVDDETPVPADQRALTIEQWRRLLHLAHEDKQHAFDMYERHYLATDGQIYWSDTHQLAAYIDDYHAALDREQDAACKGTEMITELYVPRTALPTFLDDVRADLRRQGANLIYGTIRLIERDEETFLAWAREPWACVVINLHVDHSEAGLTTAKGAFRRLIDIAIRYGGSYYLTYHRWARPDQVEACHPRLREFLRLKAEYDPAQRFQSDWYRHYRTMFCTGGAR